MDAKDKTPPSEARAVPGEPAPPPVHSERRRRSVGWKSTDVLRAVALVIAMYILVRMLWFVNPLIFVVFLGVLFGLALESGVDQLVRFRIPRPVGAALIVVVFFGALVGFGAWFAPTMREQARELRSKIPQAVDRIEDWVNQRQGGFLGLLIGGGDGSGGGEQGTAQRPTGATTAATPGGVGPIRADTAQPQARPSDTTAPGVGVAPTAAETLRERLSRGMTGVTRYLFPFLSQTVAVITGILLIIFIAVYVAADPDTYHRGLMHLFPHRHRERAGEVFTAMAAVLRRWLVTQLVAMVVIGLVTTIALMILRVEAAVALGVIAGLLEFIPTVGPILSAVPAVAMGFLDSPEKAVAVALVYIGIQFVENQLLIPLLMQGAMKLPPALTLVSQALFTLIFGFIGLLVAVPVVAAVLVPVKMLYVEGVVGDPMAVVSEDEEPDG